MQSAAGLPGSAWQALSGLLQPSADSKGMRWRAARQAACQAAWPISSSACAPLHLFSEQVTRSSGVNMAIANPSKAVPFLSAPPCQSSKLAGAETGFDPLYLSEYIDIKWAREAELKHGRICML